jgi:hypothetical protein
MKVFLGLIAKRNSFLVKHVHIMFIMLDALNISLSYEQYSVNTTTIFSSTITLPS